MTKEERAYNYADSIYKGKKDIEWDIARAGYKFGSQDQQKIDIENACKVFCKVICSRDKSSGLSCPCYGYKKLVKSMEGGAE